MIFHIPTSINISVLFINCKRLMIFNDPTCILSRMSRCGEGFSGFVVGDCTQIGKCLPDWQSQQTPPQPPPHLQLPRCSLNALSDLVTNSRLFFKLFSIKENRISPGFYYKCRSKECVKFYQPRSGMVMQKCRSKKKEELLLFLIF